MKGFAELSEQEQDELLVEAALEMPAFVHLKDLRGEDDDE